MLRALLLEDSPQDVEIIRELLIDAGFELDMDCTALEKEFISLLRSRTYDIILADFKLPGFDGFAALRWSMEICPTVPFICVSGTIGEETAVELLKQGAVDYVLKDRLARLPSAIHRALGEVKEKEDRREAETALSESEEKFRRLFESSQDAIMIMEPPSWKFTSGNPAAVKMFGAKNEEEFVSYGSWELSPDRQVDGRASAEKSKESIETAMRNGACFFEWTHRRIGGEEFSADVLLTRMERKGKMILQATVRDITERKRAEEKLTKSEEKYRSIFENVQDVYYEASIDGIILEVSPSIEIMSKGQYHRDDLIGKPMDDFYSVAGGRQALIEFLQERSSVTDHEITLKNRDGSSVACSISAKVLYDAQSVPLKIIGTMRDITERKRAEEALSQSEERFKLLHEYAPFGIILSNRSGQILEVNPAALQILGSPSAEETKKSNLLKFPLLIKSGISAALKSCIETGQAGIGEYSYISKWEKSVNLHLRYVPILDDHNQVTLVQTIMEDITERKRADEAVRESEERFRMVFENVFDGISIYIEDPDPAKRKLVECNNQYAVMAGRTREELLTLGNTLGLQRTIIDTVNDKNFESRIPGSGYMGSFSWIRPDGKDNIIEYTGMPIIWRGRLHSISIDRDITGRKQAEAALTYERNLLNALMDNTLDHIYFKDRESRFLKISKAQADAFGLDDPEQAAGKTDFDFFTKEHAHPAFEDEQKILKSGIAIVGLEEKESWPDGREGWVSTTKVPLRNVQGEIIGTFGISRDITKSKHADEERQRLITAFGQTAEAILVTDPRGIIQYVNPAFEQITGFARKEAIGQNPRILNSGQQSAGFYEELWKTISTGGKWTGRFINKKKDGTLFTDETSISPVVNKKREIINYVGVKRDITSELSLQTQLTQAQKLESIGTLASGIAHDFNNILGIIMGHTSLLERLREDLHMHTESVSAIMKASQRGASLVKQLMLFARKTEPLLESVKVNNIIGEITKLLQETFPKTITISTSLQNDLPAIVADSSQVHQLLLNLILNARDAMEKGGALSISTRTIEGETVRSRFPKVTRDRVTRQYVQIEVTDTGIGMDESTRQRIFEPFFTTKGVGKGTGLGLAVVFGIVEHHNGFIDVQSARGEGTSFAVYLPIPVHTGEEMHASGKKLEDLPGGTETILIIEDEAALMKLAKNILVSKGYTVLTAEDGMQGVELYRSHKKEIAVVLSDIGLPVFGGHDVFRKIRAINPEAKIIFASGFFDPETKSEMYKAGLKNFIQKPYMQNEVLQKIREAIDSQ
jgi:PAS domain S-box-containing protein